ncbi:endonuclease [Sorangium sp. So ce341]|uniref:endonuclease n=1 Tax=Sorangium sp. So ce341 TaxID=3133302 RepID=UPI003F5F5C67
MSSNDKVVSLLSVYSVVNYFEGLPSQIASAQVVVQNLAYDKQVAIHLKNTRGAWVDLPLSYAGPASEGFELWSGQISRPGTPVDPFLFAAKATMNGQTYWDSDGGANYRMRATQGTRLFGAVVRNASGGLRSDRSFYVNVDVQNVGFQKKVQIVYTTDGWTTTRTADASFRSSYSPGDYGSVPSPNAYGVERWVMEVNDTGASRIQYAISCSVNGQTHWDNNFGRNYTVTRAG